MTLYTYYGIIKIQTLTVLEIPEVILKHHKNYIIYHSVIQSSSLPTEIKLYIVKAVDHRKKN